MRRAMLAVSAVVLAAFAAPPVARVRIGGQTRDLPRTGKFRYDLLYQRRAGFCLDLRLILLSFWITVRGRWEDRGRKV